MTSGREAFSLLWKKVKGWSRFFYPYRRLRFTREGWLFSLLSLSIGLIAVNTGHNLFYLVFGLLLGMVIVSGMLSERVLRGIRVERHLPAEVTARIPFAVVRLQLIFPFQVSIFDPQASLLNARVTHPLLLF